MADNSQKGLGSDNMSEEQKKDIQSKGGQASHGGGRQQNEDSFFETDMGQNEDSSDSRGFGAMKEQGRDEEVSEISSLGGQSSRSGGRDKQNQE